MTKKVRTFNMTGKVEITGASTPVHKRLHVGDMKSGRVYAVVDFRVYPSVTSREGQLNGTLTFKADDTLEPNAPDFSSTGEIAWSTHATYKGISGPVNEGFQYSSMKHMDDERFFAKDLHLHVSNETSTDDVNYYVKIAEFASTEDVSSIVQLIQFSELLGQT